jgi:hypothetical protein
METQEQKKQMTEGWRSHWIIQKVKILHFPWKLKDVKSRPILWTYKPFHLDQSMNELNLNENLEQLIRNIKVGKKMWPFKKI